MYLCESDSTLTKLLLVQPGQGTLGNAPSILEPVLTSSSSLCQSLYRAEKWTTLVSPIPLTPTYQRASTQRLWHLSDMNLEATARREGLPSYAARFRGRYTTLIPLARSSAFEEVGLPIDTTRIRYLTALPPFLARSMMLVTPVVCFNLDYSLRASLLPF